jgi:SAM-dependent methyltransferase
VAARYDGLAEWYDQQFPGPFFDAVSHALDRLLGAGDGRCLDVGCGSGRYFEVLTTLGWHVTGIDESADQLRIARPRADSHGVELVKGDATALPFADASFDAVAAIMISTDVEPYERVVEEAARVLRRGGRFVHVGGHPCFVGPHSSQPDPAGRRTVGGGYRDRGFKRSSAAFHPDGIRIQVGAVHVPLDDLLNAVSASGLRLEHAVEAFDEASPPAILALRAVREAS